MEEVSTLVSAGKTRTAVRIRDALLADIAALRLPPGAKISENEVARRFGVSRQPVREAILLLGTSGLVHTEAHRSTVVLPISRSALLQTRFVREAIEVAVVSRAASGMTTGSRRAISQTLGHQRDAAAAGENERFDRLDDRFHELLCAAARVSYAWQTLAQVRVHATRVCLMARLDMAAMEQVMAEHGRILSAIEARDEARAVEQMRRHLAGFPAKLDAALARYPAYFTG